VLSYPNYAPRIIDKLKFHNKTGGNSPMADVIDYKIYGDDLQLVEVGLDPGEGVRAEVGTMTYMENGVEMDTSTGGDSLLGGLFKGFKRAVTGESFFITSFVYNGSPGTKGHVGLAAPYPGTIIPLNLGQLGGQFLCQKDSFLCAAAGTEIEVAFTKRLRSGFFGGEGFILQRLTGDGMAFVHAGGTVIEKSLAAGETLRVDTGCLVAFATTVDYDIQFVGGFKNALFGGEGLFLAKMTGPGKVYLQSLPLSRLAGRILAASRTATGENRGAAGLGGEVLGSILSGE
jgi:uncharacterized protein (TIGR00266 family)